MLHETPSVTASQMREIDRLAEQVFHLDLLQMMENAGHSLARLARQQFPSKGIQGARILVLAGPGGNGGGGMAAARRLHVWGANPTVILGALRQQLKPLPARQLASLEALDIPIHGPSDAFLESDLILDALLGYSASGNPREPMASLIRKANNNPAPILALDLPSGLDPDSGQAHDPTIRASFTLTLALPKTGLFEAHARSYVGELWLADISIPAELYRRLGIVVPPLFATDDLIQLS
ncbi:MAG: NAD(P)H-hydrate epimerase [Anaerolineales bacterium]|jgi:NAD(P)H-hydrate epimerase